MTCHSYTHTHTHTAQAQFVAFNRDRKAALAASAELQRQRSSQREAAKAKAAAHAPFADVRVPVLNLPPQAIELTTMRQFGSAHPLPTNLPPPPEEDFVLGELPPRPPPPPALPGRPPVPSLWLVNAPPFISPPPPPAPSHHEMKRFQRAQAQAAEQARLRGEGEQAGEVGAPVQRHSFLCLWGERN